MKVKSVDHIALTLRCSSTKLQIWRSSERHHRFLQPREAKAELLWQHETQLQFSTSTPIFVKIGVKNFEMGVKNF